MHVFFCISAQQFCYHLNNVIILLNKIAQCGYNSPLISFGIKLRWQATVLSNPPSVFTKLYVCINHLGSHSTHTQRVIPKTFFRESLMQTSFNMFAQHVERIILRGRSLPVIIRNWMGASRKLLNSKTDGYLLACKFGTLSGACIRAKFPDDSENIGNTHWNSL